ncbi:MAG: sulfurtransferase TusA family protein [Pseudomonadota bacterium]
MPTHHVNARRLLCPMPVIRLQAAIAKAEIGDCVEIVCTDYGTQNDIPAWCRVHGHELTEHRTEDREYWFVVTKR